MIMRQSDYDLMHHATKNGCSKDNATVADHQKQGPTNSTAILDVGAGTCLLAKWPAGCRQPRLVAKYAQFGLRTRVRGD